MSQYAASLIRSRRQRRLTFAFSTVVGLGGLGVATPAWASITGPQGVEIEGPRDRRGFYYGPGLGGGATFLKGDMVGNTAASFHLGGGVSKRFTLGANAAFWLFFPDGVGYSFIADVEGTGFLYKGLFLRASLGAAGVPVDPDDTKLGYGFGGTAGLGYEFFLNQTAAMSVAANYDWRLISDDGTAARSTIFAGLRFTFY